MPRRRRRHDHACRRAALSRRADRARRCRAIVVAALTATLATLAALAASPSRPTAPTAPTRCPPAAAPLDAERFARGLRDAVDHGFLWRIVKDGRTSFLYGTIHAARVEWMFPGPAHERGAGARATSLALELDVLDPGIRARLARARRRAPATSALPADARRARSSSA